MNNFLTQSALAERLVQKSGISVETAKNFSTLFFNLVKRGLKTSERFSVYNFGTFKKTWIEATTGLNPSNGQKIDIPAHWRIKFIPCPQVAKRINKPFAHLKPVPIDDQKIGPDGLYYKAEFYLNQPEEAEKPEEPVEEQKGQGLLKKADKIHSELPTVVDEELYDDDDEIEPSKKGGKIAAIAGISGLLLLILISLLVKSCTSKPKLKKEIAKTPVEPKTEIQKTLPAEEEKPATTDEYDEIEAELIFDSYTVPSGMNYHKIAEAKYGNRHLWPMIYSANKASNPDPDFIPSYKTINLPEVSAKTLTKKQVSTAFLDAYNGYLLMIEKESDSPKNAERKNRAVRAIVSAELVSPGFIQENKNRILPEYATLAQNIIRHQYGK